uniref:Uncharacterized protein n=1 Tax=Arundo donax TaxID=35708 RepID=A0A0A8YDF7_ARUDO
MRLRSLITGAPFPSPPRSPWLPLR